MKRNEIINTLLNEGFSEKTLLKFSEKQLFELHQGLFNESTIMVPKEKTQEIDALKKTRQTFATYENKGLSKKQSEKMDTDKDGDIDSTDLKNLRTKKKTEVKEKKDVSESLWGLSLAAAMKTAEEKLGRKPTKDEIEKELKKLFPEKDKKENKDKKEVKEWVNSLAENNYHSFTSKNEIMELIQTKMTQHEVGPNVNKGHNGIPEFMSYNSIKKIKKSEVAEGGTKTAPAKPKTSPGTKPKPKTPYRPGPGKNPKPKALKEDKNEN